MIDTLRRTYAGWMSTPWRSWIAHWLVALFVGLVLIMFGVQEHTAGVFVFAMFFGREFTNMQEHWGHYHHWRNSQGDPTTFKDDLRPYIIDGVMDMVGPTAALIALSL